jgi:hypothetical protein
MLWVLMALVVLPWLGWNAFGVGLRPSITVATLLIQLVYSATVGWLATRQAVKSFCPVSAPRAPGYRIRSSASGPELRRTATRSGMPNFLGLRA